MNVHILQGIAGAKKAIGTAVVIDVFRAITVESYLIANGATRLIPVGEVSFAYNYQKAHPETVLIGERGGAIIPGFDYGNSPSQVKDVDFTGKTVLHTTSAGTQGVANAVNAEEILVASLVNARATAEYLLKKNPKEISLVCMGLEGVQPTQEDNLCAEYIKSILEGRPIVPAEHIERLKQTDGAKFFDEAQQSVFPEADFWLSTEADRFRFALRVRKDEETGLNTVVKVTAE